MKTKKQNRANRAVLPAAARARFFVSFLARALDPFAGSGRVTGNLWIATCQQQRMVSIEDEFLKPHSGHLKRHSLYA